MVDRDRPIGIFDSGVGGLTVLKEVSELLPQENLVYFGDTARFPYGPRPLEEVRNFAFEIIDFLQSYDVKLLVMACNSMTAAAFSEARKKYDTPLIGVIEPAVRRAVRATHNRKIGVLGTKATIESREYEKSIRTTRQNVEVYTQICEKFVEHVESGDMFSEELFQLADDYLTPLISVGVDTLVLGCTHYPLLRGVLHSVTKGAVELISSAEEVAKDVYATLVAKNLLRREREVGSRIFIVSGDSEQFRRVGSRFLPGLQQVESKPWSAKVTTA